MSSTSSGADGEIDPYPTSRARASATTRRSVHGDQRVGNVAHQPRSRCEASACKVSVDVPELQGDGGEGAPDELRELFLRGCRKVN